MPSIVHEIIHPFPNFNNSTIDVWKMISNSVPQFIAIVDVIIYLWGTGVYWNGNGSFEDFGASGSYLRQGQVIASHSILWDAITYPCLRYPLLAPKSSFLACKHDGCQFLPAYRIPCRLCDVGDTMSTGVLTVLPKYLLPGRGGFWKLTDLNASSRWCHNERDVVSNHRRSIVCSTVCSGADQLKTSKHCVTGLCKGNSPVTKCIGFTCCLWSEDRCSHQCWDHYPLDTWRNNDIIITSKRRRDVALT